MHQFFSRRAVLCVACVLTIVVPALIALTTSAGDTNSQAAAAESTTLPSQIVPTTAHATQPLVTAPPVYIAPAAPIKISRREGGALIPEIQNALAQQTFQVTAIYGGAFGQNPFQDLPGNGILIGFRIGMGKFIKNDIIQLLQPIYLTPSGQRFGESYGLGTGDLQMVVAPDGYAVGAVTIRGGGGLDSLKLTFMRIRGDQLDPTDSCITSRIGGSGGGETYINGKGTPIIGVNGRFSDNGKYLGLGLIFLHDIPTSKPR
jgi:hypothetical protein